MQAVDARIAAGVYDVLSVDASVRSRVSHGGTAPSEVRKRVAAAKKELGL
jgi:argininosuccinate lyase